MPSYVILTKVAPEAVKEPNTLLDLEKEVKNRVQQECPDVKWISNYTIMGPYDYLDVFEAPDNDQAMRVSTIIRSVGHSSTELWPATSWDDFKQNVLKQS